MAFQAIVANRKELLAPAQLDYVGNTLDSSTNQGLVMVSANVLGMMAPFTWETGKMGSWMEPVF